MPGSKNKAGTRVSQTEHRKAKITAIQKIGDLFRQDRRSGKRSHGHFFGRFSTNHRNIQFYINSQHTQEKLDAIRAIHPMLFPKIIPVDDLELTDYERLAAVILQLDKNDSPIKIWRQSLWPSPSSLTISRRARATVRKALRDISMDLVSASTKTDDKQEISLLEYLQSNETESLLDSFDFIEEEFWSDSLPSSEDNLSDTDIIAAQSDDSIKSVSAIITPETLREAQKNRRQRSTKLFGLSAEAYATLEKTSDGQKRLEFLHLLAHVFEGEFEKYNIVIGSWCANTIMLMYDNAAKKLLEQQGCTAIKISIECRMQPKVNAEGYTEHAAQIKMIFETDTGFKFESPLIDANSENRPTIAEYKGIETIIVNSYLASKPQQTLHSIPESLLQTPTKQKENSPDQYTPQPCTPLSHVTCSFFGQNTLVTPPKISEHKPLPFNLKVG